MDTEGYGLDPLYRMYETMNGWVFLAVRSAGDASAFAKTMGAYDPAFPDIEVWSRPADGDRASALERILGAIFKTRRASDWERELSEQGIGCVHIHDGAPQNLLQVDPQAAAEYASIATSPVFDEHLRPGATVHFSRSGSRAEGFCLCGDHTDDIVLDMGYTREEIADLRHANRVG